MMWDTLGNQRVNEVATVIRRPVVLRGLLFGMTMDLSEADRTVMLTCQDDAQQNGLWVVHSGKWTRR